MNSLAIWLARNIWSVCSCMIHELCGNNPHTQFKWEQPYLATWKGLFNWIFISDWASYLEGFLRWCFWAAGHYLHAQKKICNVPIFLNILNKVSPVAVSEHVFLILLLSPSPPISIAISISASQPPSSLFVWNNITIKVNILVVPGVNIYS